MRKAVFFAAVWIATIAMDRPSEVSDVLPEAVLLGETGYRRVFLKLYDAQLWSASDRFVWEQPFALSLQYSRSFSSERLANASIIEMARLAGTSEESLEALREPLTQCFANVEEGDRITGYARDADNAVFYFNGEKNCDVSWPGFRKAFFSIWLSDLSRAPEKARKLRGDDA